MAVLAVAVCLAVTAWVAAYGGGTSVDNEGNEVENSPSPGLGGYTQGQQQYVTETDSTTGETIIVKNTSGGDSMVTVQTFNELRCLGVANGVATLSNGSSTWTCVANSCSQALMSAHINGGACAPNKGTSPYGESTSNSQMPNITGDSSYSGTYKWYLDGDYPTFGLGIKAVISTINSQGVLDRHQADSLASAQKALWQQVFGSDLSNIDDIKDSLSKLISASSTHDYSQILNAISSVSAANAVNIANQTSNINSRITSASSTIALAIGDASTSIIQANSSASQSIKNSIDSYSSDVQNTMLYTLDMRNYLVDSLVYKMDSGFSVNLENWYNDHLLVTMNDNAEMIAEHIDSLKVTVEHDSLLDTINANFRSNFALSPVANFDTLDYGKMYKDGYDASLGDTSVVYDSSLAEFIRGTQWMDSSDFNDGGFVDSVEGTFQRRFDSTNTFYNSRSDSLTMGFADTMMKYSGLDSGGNAIKEFFAS